MQLNAYATCEAREGLTIQHQFIVVIINNVSTQFIEKMK